MTAKDNRFYREKLPAVTEPHSYMPQNFTEAMQFCEFLAKSDFVPKAFKGKPGDIMACIQFGGERGIPPMQALTNIQVINGRPSMYGDLQLAMVQRVPGLLVHHKEYFELDAKGSTVAAICEVQRRGEKNIHVVRFSVDDAQRADLLNKPGPWKQYPKRMLMWRARGFALRDKFADALGGLISTEEAIDMPGGTIPDEINRHLAEQAQIEDAEIVGEARSGNVTEAGRSDDETPRPASTQHISTASFAEVGTTQTMIVDEADGKPGVGEQSHVDKPVRTGELDTGRAAAPDVPADADEKAMIEAMWKRCKAPFPKKLAALQAVGFTTIEKLRKSQIEACAEALQGL